MNKAPVLSEERIAEVEQIATRLIRKFTNSQIGGISREAYLIQQAKAEEAREIFGDIEDKLFEAPLVDAWGIHKDYWQSLKSKYLEGK